MALFDNILNSNDPELQRQALALAGQVENQYQPTQSPVLQGVIPQSVMPREDITVDETTDIQPEQEGRSGVMGVLDGLAQLFTDPAITNSLMAFDASMRGDAQGQAAYNNRYAEVMSQRRAEQADKLRDQLQRERQLEDRTWQEKQAYQNALYNTYSAPSVQKYIESGDPSVLESKPMTEWQQAQNNTRQAAIDSKASNAQVVAARKNLENLGNSQEPYQDANGNWYIYEKGQPKLAGAQMQKTLSENKRTTQPSANEVQMNEDLAFVRDQANKGNVGSFTGQIVGRNEFLQDIASSTLGNADARKAQRSAERINGMMLSQGVADAKAMGASGINTAAEAQMYFKGMPRLDFTSDSALIDSIDKIQAYTQRFNAAKRGGMQPSSTQQSASPTQPVGGITMKRIG